MVAQARQQTMAARVAAARAQSVDLLSQTSVPMVALEQPRQSPEQALHGLAAVAVVVAMAAQVQVARAALAAVAMVGTIPTLAH